MALIKVCVINARVQCLKRVQISREPNKIIPNLQKGEGWERNKF